MNDSFNSINNLFGVNKVINSNNKVIKPKRGIVTLTDIDDNSFWNSKVELNDGTKLSLLSVCNNCDNVIEKDRFIVGVFLLPKDKLLKACEIKFLKSKLGGLSYNKDSVKILGYDYIVENIVVNSNSSTYEGYFIDFDFKYNLKDDISSNVFTRIVRIRDVYYLIIYNSEFIKFGKVNSNGLSFSFDSSIMYDINPDGTIAEVNRVVKNHFVEMDNMSVVCR